MERPTAMIREVLLLQMMEEAIHRALIEARKDLNEAGIKLIEVKDTEHSIDVKYKAGEIHDEGFYMKRMLVAEARGYLRRLPDVKRFLDKS